MTSALVSNTEFRSFKHLRSNALLESQSFVNLQLQFDNSKCTTQLNSRTTVHFNIINLKLAPQHYTKIDLDW